MLDLELDLDQARDGVVADTQLSRAAMRLQRNGNVVVALAGVEQRLLHHRRALIPRRRGIGGTVEAVRALSARCAMPVSWGNTF